MCLFFQDEELLLLQSTTVYYYFFLVFGLPAEVDAYLAQIHWGEKNLLSLKKSLRIMMKIETVSTYFFVVRLHGLLGEG